MFCFVAMVAGKLGVKQIDKWQIRDCNNKVVAPGLVTTVVVVAKGQIRERERD